MFRYYIKGRKIEFDTNFEVYNNFRKKFTENAEHEIIIFYNRCEEIKSLEELVHKMPIIYEEGILRAYELAEKLLVRINIMDQTADTLMQKYDSELRVTNGLEDLYNRYKNILNAQAQLKYEREVEKNTRSRWVGGGYGLQGAIKGAMIAGMLNAGTDIIRSSRDWATGSRDYSIINKGKKSILGDEELNSKLAAGVFDSCFNVFYAVINEISIKGLLKEINWDSEATIAKFKNVCKYIDDEEKKLDQIVECITEYPYYEEYFLYLIEWLGDENREIEKLGIALGYKDDIEYFKNFLLSRVEQKIPDTAKQARKILNEYERQIKRLGAETIYSINMLQIFKDTVTELDIKERTYDEIIYDSVKEMEDNKVVYAEALKIFETIDKTNLDTVINGVTQLKTLIEQHNGKKCLVKIQEWVDKFEVAIKIAKDRERDEKERTVEGLLLDSQKEAELTKKLVPEIKEKLAKINVYSPEELEEYKKELSSCKCKINNECIDTLDIILKNLHRDKIQKDFYIPKDVKKYIDEVTRKVNNIKFNFIRKFSERQYEEYLSFLEDELKRISSKEYQDKYEKAKRYQKALKGNSFILKEVILAILMTGGSIWLWTWIIDIFINFKYLYTIAKGLTLLMPILGVSMYSSEVKERKQNLTNKKQWEEISKNGGTVIDREYE